MAGEDCTTNTLKMPVSFLPKLSEQPCYHWFASSTCYYSSPAEGSSHLVSLLLRLPVYRISTAPLHLAHPFETSFLMVSLVSKKWLDLSMVLVFIHLMRLPILLANWWSLKSNQVACVWQPMVLDISQVTRNRFSAAGFHSTLHQVDHLSLPTPLFRSLASWLHQK